MIQIRTVDTKPHATRDIYQILRHPRNDAEEHQADEHIRREADRIQESWSERERESREVQPVEAWQPMVLTECGRE